MVVVVVSGTVEVVVAAVVVVVGATVTVVVGATVEVVAVRDVVVGSSGPRSWLLWRRSRSAAGQRAHGLVLAATCEQQRQEPGG